MKIKFYSKLLIKEFIFSFLNNDRPEITTVPKNVKFLSSNYTKDFLIIEKSRYRFYQSSFLIDSKSSSLFLKFLTGHSNSSTIRCYITHDFIPISIRDRWKFILLSIICLIDRLNIYQTRLISEVDGCYRLFFFRSCEVLKDFRALKAGPRQPVVIYHRNSEDLFRVHYMQTLFILSFQSENLLLEPGLIFANAPLDQNVQLVDNLVNPGYTLRRAEALRTDKNLSGDSQLPGLLVYISIGTY